MKILDVTLRDGGFVNDFGLTDEDALRIIALLDEAGLDAIEIGYLTGLPPSHIQPRSAPGICYAWPVERIAEVAADTRTPLVAMVHPGGRVPIDFDELSRSKLRLVRVTITPESDTDWRRITDALGAAGVPFTVNLTLASWMTPESAVDHARQAEQAGADLFYIADTNSALLPHQVEDLFHRLRDGVDMPLGFHAHDCKRLALANVAAAERAGAEWADSSLIGIGRGAGNAVTEVLHELDGRGQRERHRLLRALPDVAAGFGVRPDERLWQQICAFMDIWPATIEQLEQIGEESGQDRYALAAERLLGKPLSRPPRADEVRAALGL